MASGKRKKDGNVLEAEETKLPPNKKYKSDNNKSLETFQHSDALTVVKDFLQRCETVGHTKVVVEYFESGKTAQDLVNLLQGNKTAGFVPVLSALHFIVMTVIGDAPAHKNDTEEACKYLLDNFFSEMQDMLSQKSSAKHKKVVLKLFAAMVTLNAKLGRTVLIHIKFNPVMLSTLTKHTQPSETSVRTCFIHFLMAYFIDKNPLLISSLLQKKGVIASIISGLIYDDACTVNLVLTTLYENVIMNTSVSKTLKLHIFNTHIIQSLLKLYNWDGPEKLKMKNKDELEQETKDDGDRKLIAETLHNFLVALCTSHKYGVAFHDRNVGTASKKCNELLQGVVESMEKPWENEYLSDLTQKILASCPDLVKKVISMLEPYLEPRISMHWMKAVEFAKNIVQITDPDVNIKPYANSLKMQQLISVVHTLAVPANLLHIINEQMIQHKHLLVRHEGTKLLSIMLEKFLYYVKALKSWKLIDESILQSICGEVMKQMPNPEVILSLWKRALNCKAEDESASLDDMPTVSLHLISVVDLWLLYNQCFPSTLSVTNSFELLNDIQDLPDGDVAHLQLKVLKFIMTLDSSMLIPGRDAFKTALLQLSKFTYHSSQDLVFDSRNLFTELLINSGIFEGVESEVNIWALCCFRVPHNQVNLVTQFLLKALLDINKNPNLYANAISQSEESAENDASKDNNKLEQILEDLLETQSYVNEVQSDGTATRYCYQVTLSPLLPAALKIASSSNHYRENSTVLHFLSCVIIHLLHSHPTPEVLWRLLLSNFDPLPLNISTYTDGWLNKNMIISVEDILGENSIEAKFSRNLINDESCLFTSLNLECTTDAAEDEVVPVILKKQTVFVSKASVKNADPVHLVLLYKLTVFYLTQMATQDILEEISKKQCKDALIILLTILQSFEKKHKGQYTANCLKFTFAHPILVSLFRPLHKKKANKIVEIIEELISSVSLSTTESYHLLIPFKQKIVHQIIKYVKKCQKGKVNEERNLPTLSLYGLTSLDISLLMDHLVQVPVESLCCCKEKVQLSTLGKLLVQLLDLCVSIHEPLPSQCVTGVAQHLVKMKKLQVTDINLLVNSLYKYLDKFRHNIEHIPGHLFCSLLLQETVDSSSVQLVTLLFRNKANLVEFIVSLVRKNKKFRSKTELLFPLLSALSELSNGTLEESILEKVYTHYCNEIKQGILAPSEGAAWLRDYEDIAVLLVDKCMDLNICVSLCNQMESGIKIEKSEDVCLEITRAVLCKVNRLAPEQFKADVTLLVVMQLVNDLWKRKLSDKKQLEDIYLFVKKCAVSCIDKNVNKWQELKSNNMWLNFVRLALKYGIQVHKEVLDTEGYLLCTLTELCSIVYITAEKNNEVMKIFQMVLSHSEFLSVILGEATRKKSHLVELLLVLMEKNPSVMVSSHIPIMLGAYHATLGEIDQKLLKVLKMYEAAGVSFHNYRPYLWGEAAVNHYSVKSKARFALWRQPKPSQVLDLLDTETVQQTVKRFPITRDLDGHSSTVIGDEVYDIAFLLPLFSHLLAPEQFVQTHKFISCGGLALTLSALACQCEMTRKAAYHVLSRFCFHEEASRNAKRRMLWIQFLNAVRRGIADLNDGNVPQLSSVVATFLARASLIISQANHPLYRQIQSFIIAKPSMNLQIVPEFLTYFHSADVECKLYRHWILEVLRDGFRSELDMKVCLRSAVFKLLSNFYFSVLADINVRTLILEVIDSAVRVSKVALLLVRDFGLIPHLFHVIRESSKDSVGKIVNILHNLWTSLSSEKQKGCNIDWSQPMMLLLLSVLLLKPTVTDSELKTYLLTFHAVLSCSNSKFILYLLSLENMNHLMQFVTKILGPIPECEDMLKYDCKYIIDEKNFFIGSRDEKNSVYYLKKILMEWFCKVRNCKALRAKH